MADYSKAKIYRICAPGCEQVYVGSTTKELDRRLQDHLADFKRGGCSSKAIIQFPNPYIELIEEFPCANKRELERREGEIIRNTPNSVNQFIAGRTMREWRDDNRDKLREYRLANRERENELQRLRRAAKKKINVSLPVE